MSDFSPSFLLTPTPLGRMCDMGLFCPQASNIYTVYYEKSWKVFDKVEDAGISTGGHLLTDFRYANDHILCYTHWCNTTMFVCKTSEEYGLILNAMKTKCIYIDFAKHVVLCPV